MWGTARCVADDEYSLGFGLELSLTRPAEETVLRLLFQRRFFKWLCTSARVRRLDADNLFSTVILHPAVFQIAAGPRAAVCLNKAIKIVSVQPTTVATA